MPRPSGGSPEARCPTSCRSARSPRVGVPAVPPEASHSGASPGGPALPATPGAPGGVTGNGAPPLGGLSFTWLAILLALSGPRRPVVQAPRPGPGRVAVGGPHRRSRRPRLEPPRFSQHPGQAPRRCSALDPSRNKEMDDAKDNRCHGRMLRAGGADWGVDAARRHGGGRGPGQATGAACRSGADRPWEGLTRIPTALPGYARSNTDCVGRASARGRSTAVSVR